MYKQLEEYKELFGDCLVPRGYAQNARLASWVAEQRKQYKLLNCGKPSSITTDRITLLNGLDFTWNAQEAAWERRVNELQRFRAQHGHCHVPVDHQEFPKLGLWVKEQRRHHSLMKHGIKSHMSPFRVAALDRLGFCWDTHQATWSERLNELVDFKARFGTCLVPTDFTEMPKLATWVHHQRRQYKLFKEGKPAHITPDRIRALDCLGFIWNPRDRPLSKEERLKRQAWSSGVDLGNLYQKPPKRERIN